MSAIMKTSCFVLLFFILVVTPLYAKTSPAVQQLLDTALQQEAAFQHGSKQYQAELAFTAQLSVPTSGHLTLKWGSTDHWWARANLSGYEQITIRNGEWEYTERNLAYTPIRIRDLFGVLGLEVNPVRLNARKEKFLRENGEEILCVKGSPEHFESELHNVCVDAMTHELVSDEWRGGRNEHWEKVFSDFLVFEGQNYPQKFNLLEHGKKVISADLENIKAAPFDPALLTPPADAIARRKCAGMKQPQPLNAIPTEPGGVGDAGQMTAVVTILTDGSVGDVQLVGKNGQAQKNNTVLEQIKGFRFRPAMCGDTPVVADIVVAMP